ncbi:MAG: DesA family fatty acid desaturase [Burkholderiaceae bacterium]|nr:fatty acid desaturase [Polynucleobacter sp.]MCF8187255.1 fatty acid desaturase [Sulfuritalea sp.]
MSLTSGLDPVLDFLLNGLLHATGWQIVIYTLIVTHITIAGVTIFLHRCQAHRALDLHAIPSHFFRFWLWLTTGMVTKEWAAIHRKHHAKCETEEDPHSPVTRGIDKVVYEGAELYRIEARNTETIEKYGHGTPDDWIERNVYTKRSALGVSMLLVINILLFGVLGLSVWAVQMMWIPVTAAGIINGIGHFWGYRNFNCKDASTNILPWGIIIGGEELHNNHHTYGTSAKLSSKWYEFDIGWMYITILSFFGLAKVKKVAPAPRFDREKLVADLDTLQSIVANRYDVMAKYALSLRQAWGDEIANIRAKSAIEKDVLKSSKKLLQCEPATLEAAQQQQLSEIFKYSDTLKTMHEMRTELAALWERSHSSSDQLLAQLRDWCARAEASGIRSLEQFSLRLRSYA